MVEKWKTVARQKAGDFRIFSAEFVDRTHPVFKHNSRFIVLDSPSWVNILPITTDNDVVFVRQYRHGIDDLTLEIPGGMVDLGEDPCEAGMRECLEETGFMAPIEASFLGVHHPNPAFMTNKCYTYLWPQCQNTTVQELDANEDMDVVLAPLEMIPSMIRSGEITHSLVIAAFMFFWLNTDTTTNPFTL